MSTAPRSTVRRPLIGALLALVALALAAGTALAHAELETSDPADGAVLDTNPTTITLSFTERLDPSKSSFKLFAPDGSTVGTGAATGPRVMTLDTEPLPDGTYRIKWTSASADDGDIERGELGFTVELNAPSLNPSPSATVSPTENDFITPEPSASAAPATPGQQVTPSPVPPTPAASAAPSDPASSTSDVLLPIVVGLLLVGGIGAFVLRRSRGA